MSKEYDYDIFPLIHRIQCQGCKAKVDGRDEEKIIDRARAAGFTAAWDEGMGQVNWCAKCTVNVKDMYPELQEQNNDGQ